MSDRPPRSSDPRYLRVTARHRYTVAEAGQQVGGISQTMFYELVNAGELSTVKIGRGTFLAASELDAYIQRAAPRR